MSKTVLMVGTFDSKGEEYSYLRQRLLEAGNKVLSVNAGIFEAQPGFEVDIDAEQLAEAANASLDELRGANDRGRAIRVMSEGGAKLIAELHEQVKFDGIIGMGGTGGTSLVTAMMRALPLEVPKLCVSTAAAGNTEAYVGSKNIVMLPSIVDVAGLNRISRIIFDQAAGAISGMVNAPQSQRGEERPVVAASMFGNTTECVNSCVEQLESMGYEVLVFHATGTGGKTMESLVRDGMVDAVLDITTTEWADTVCGGVFDAGPERLDAPGEQGVPHLIVPGCVDMANFGPIETVPEKYRHERKLYEWNPSVTLMRTNVEENRRMGEIFAEKANRAKGPVAVLLPLRGVSILDGEGERFCDREADQAMFDALKAGLREGIEVTELDANINDEIFARKAVNLMVELMGHKEQEQAGAKS
jgi:uncharacterized protein (UPF0261 family)